MPTFVTKFIPLRGSRSLGLQSRDTANREGQLRNGAVQELKTAGEM